MSRPQSVIAKVSSRINTQVRGIILLLYTHFPTKAMVKFRKTFRNSNFAQDGICYICGQLGLRIKVCPAEILPPNILLR